MKCQYCGDYMDKINDDSNTWYCANCGYKWNERGLSFLKTIVFLIILAIIIFA